LLSFIRNTSRGILNLPGEKVKKKEETSHIGRSLPVLYFQREGKMAMLFG